MQMMQHGLAESAEMQVQHPLPPFPPSPLPLPETFQAFTPAIAWQQQWHA